MKTPEPQKGNPSAIKNSAKCTTLSPREARTLTALAGRYRLSDAGRAVATELMKEAI